MSLVVSARPIEVERAAATQQHKAALPARHDPRRRFRAMRYPPRLASTNRTILTSRRAKPQAVSLLEAEYRVPRPVVHLLLHLDQRVDPACLLQGVQAPALELLP